MRRMTSSEMSSIERLLVTDALLDALRVDAPRVDAAHEVPDPIAHRRAERAVEHRARRVEHVGDGVDAASLERLRGLGSDAPQRPDGQRPQEGVRVGRGDDQQPVGLAHRRGDLRDVLRRGDADAARQARLFEDPSAQRTGDLARTPPQPPGAAHIEERLVDRERLDERSHVAEDLHDLARDLDVAVEVRQHDDRRRAQAQRLTDGHRRADAESTRLVRGARDDRAALRRPDDDGLAAQRRVVELLDRRVERVHVDMEDAGAGVVGTLE